MSEKTIFIEIFQPFAQYRNPFTFYYAQTYPLPPKSTIIGMLQNAVGDWYGNEYGIKNWWNLKVSVHGGFESTFWNYQSLIKGELTIDKNGRWINRHERNPGGNIGLPLYGEGITSQRSPVYQQELFNGHLYIFIQGYDTLINKIKESLEKPKKVLYLGRSEDVVFIRSVKEVKPAETEEGVDSIKLTYPTYILREGFPIEKQRYPIYSIPTEVIFENNGNPIKHKSEITKETERKPDFKPVIYTGSGEWVILKEKVDVEFFNVDDSNVKEIRIFKDHGWL